MISRLKAHLVKVGLTQVTLSKELGESPQNLSLILRGTNNPSAETALHMLEILEPRIMKELVDPPKMPRESTRDSNEPRTLHSALEVIADLRAELASVKAAPNLQTLPPKPPATPAPATPTPPAATLTTERAKATLASASTADLLNALILARKEGNSKVADQIQAEVRARAATGGSSRQPPAKPTLTFPATATTPAQIRTVFDNTSMDGLREMLQTEKDPVRRKTIFREIKKREQEG